MKLIKNGQLTGTGTFIAGLTGILLVLYTLLYAEDFWIGILSFSLGILVLLATALSNSAASIGLSPLTNDPLGWRKAKKTYGDSPAKNNPDSE